jgi:hypothetical protein
MTMESGNEAMVEDTAYEVARMLRTVAEDIDDGGRTSGVLRALVEQSRPPVDRSDWVELGGPQ